MELNNIQDVQNYILQKATDNIIFEREQQREIERQAPFRKATWRNLSYEEKINELIKYQTMEENILNKREEET